MDKAIGWLIGWIISSLIWGTVIWFANRLFGGNFNWWNSVRFAFVATIVVKLTIEYLKFVGHNASVFPRSPLF